MGIMVILIPMIIYMFTFHIIRVQKIEAPRRGSCAGAECQQPKKPELTVIVRDGRGFEISWRQEVAMEVAQVPFIPMAGTEYDFDTLHRILAQLKTDLATAGAPATRVNISASDDVPWEVVSHTMDAATVIHGKPARQLFEKVVLTVVD